MCQVCLTLFGHTYNLFMHWRTSCSQTSTTATDIEIQVSTSWYFETNESPSSRKQKRRTFIAMCSMFWAHWTERRNTTALVVMYFCRRIGASQIRKLLWKRIICRRVIYVTCLYQINFSKLTEMCIGGDFESMDVSTATTFVIFVEQFSCRFFDIFFQKIERTLKFQRTR